MKTLKLTAEHFDQDGNYIGAVDVSDYDGHIEIAADLGYVKFNSIAVKGWLLAKAGTGIEAGTGIKCQLVLSFTKRLFAGVSVFRSKADEIKHIECGKLAGGGVVCYGDVTETGLQQEATAPLSGKTVSVTVDGITHEAIIK